MRASSKLILVAALAATPAFAQDRAQRLDPIIEVCRQGMKEAMADRDGAAPIRAYLDRIKADEQTRSLVWDICYAYGSGGADASYQIEYGGK